MPGTDPAREAQFGEEWNSYTRMFEAHWYDDNEFVLDMPFSSKTVRFDRDEARALRKALNRFLGEF